MLATTEQLHSDALGLDDRPAGEVASLLIEAQNAAAAVVKEAASQIASGAFVMAQTLAEGGVLYYVGAGSSGLLAALDAQELGGTFSIPPCQVRILMAGGLPTGVEMPGCTEDGAEGIEAGLAGLCSRDTVILVSASGSTPYTLRALQIARKSGAPIIAIANNPGSPLLSGADITIALPTPPELLSGSTRLGAGTAQKIALNTLSTTMAVIMGYVHDGMMVNVRADNAKLRDRATRIVSNIALVNRIEAQETLDKAGGEVKLASLMAAHSISVDEASACLERVNGNLRAAIARKE
ncbi:MAG: N-acetylmuramic acid 6-phosphate etherase [Pseudomonadota bacterium]